MTSASGKYRTISFDDNGNGAIDRVETDNMTSGANGSTIETLSDYEGPSVAKGVLVEQTVTTTTVDASGTTVSITRDVNGDGVVDQTETQVTSASGTFTDTITNTPGNYFNGKTTSTYTNNGLYCTTKYDLDGNGTIDLTTDNTSIDLAQNRKETVSDYNGDSTSASALRDQTITTTNAPTVNAAGARVNGQTTQYDFNGDGVFDQTSTLTITVATDGSSVSTQTDANNDGSLIRASQTATSKDDLSITTLIDTYGKTDAGKNPIYDEQITNSTTVNSGNSRTETVKDYYYVNGAPTTLKSETVTIKGADGISHTTEIDSHGALNSSKNPIWDSVETVAVDAAHNNNVVDTLKLYNADGTLSSETVTTTSADTHSHQAIRSRRQCRRQRQSDFRQRADRRYDHKRLQELEDRDDGLGR